jgi:hypothetical protein
MGVFKHDAPVKAKADSTVDFDQVYARVTRENQRDRPY